MLMHTSKLPFPSRMTEHKRHKSLWEAHYRHHDNLGLRESFRQAAWETPRKVKRLNTPDKEKSAL